MALLASQCRSRIVLSSLLKRVSLVTQIPDRNVVVKSNQFPEFSLLYDFDKIKNAARFNRMKMHATILYPSGIAVLLAGQTLGYVAPHYIDSFAFFGFAITIFLHSVGFLFNNVVGYIYIKDDENTIKISYVGYWGQRMNVDTTIDAVYSFSDLPSRLSNPWYQRVRLTNSKETYKLYLTAGRILDNNIFDGIFGKVY